MLLLQLLLVGPCCLWLLLE